MKCKERFSNSYLLDIIQKYRDSVTDYLKYKAVWQNYHKSNIRKLKKICPNEF